MAGDLIVQIIGHVVIIRKKLPSEKPQDTPFTGENSKGTRLGSKHLMQKNTWL